MIKEKICPKCDSDNVELVSSNDEREMWLCQSCYHTFEEAKIDKVVTRIVKREVKARQTVKKKAKIKSKMSKSKRGEKK